MSIKPKYAELILRGEKTFEIRRKFTITPKTRKVLIYASSPVCKIIGGFTIGRIVQGDTSDGDTEDFYAKVEGCCLTKAELDEYILKGHCPNPKGIEVRDVYRLYKPISLNEIGVSRPPQSHMYIKIENLELWTPKEA